MKIEKYFDKKQKLNCWRIDVTIHGKRIRQGGFAKKANAEAALAAIRLEFERARYGLPTGLPGYTLVDLEARIEKDKKMSANRAAIFREFVEFVGESTPIVHLSRANIADFLMHLQERELMPGTLGLYLDHVSACLHSVGRYFAALEEYQPPKFPTRPRGQARQRVLSKEELGIFFATMALPHLPGEHPHTPAIRLRLLDVARLMLLTGARREELLLVTPERINFNWKTMLLKSSKTGREHTIALNDLAIAILKSRAGETAAGTPLFPSLPGWQVIRILGQVARHADLCYGQQEDGGWSLHDFRRTAATVIETAGIPYSAVSAQLGHQRRDVTARYTVPQLDTLRRAAAVLDEWCQGIEGITTGLAEAERRMTG